MGVSSGRRTVSSLSDIQQLFSPLSSDTFSKETIVNTQTSAPSANNADQGSVERVLAEALDQIRAARTELGQQVAEAKSKAAASTEAVDKLKENISQIDLTVSDKMSKIDARVNDLEAAAKAAAAAQPGAKKPVYKRALDIAQQVGGVAACVAGVAYGGKLAYDRFSGQGDSTNA